MATLLIIGTCASFTSQRMDWLKAMPMGQMRRRASAQGPDAPAVCEVALQRRRAQQGCAEAAIPSQRPPLITILRKNVVNRLSSRHERRDGTFQKLLDRDGRPIDTTHLEKVWRSGSQIGITKSETIMTPETFVTF